MHGAILPLPQDAFMAWFSVKKQRDCDNYKLGEAKYRLLEESVL
jgi:hypothetical protein